MFVLHHHCKSKYTSTQYKFHCIQFFETVYKAFSILNNTFLCVNIKPIPVQHFQLLYPINYIYS